MERDFQVEVGVGIDVAALWLDGEVLLVNLRVPLEVSLHISKVAQLQALGESASLDDAAEGDDLVHKLELDAMGDSSNREERSVLLNAFHFHDDFTGEGRESALGVEPNSHRKGFLRLQSVGGVRIDRHAHSTGCEGSRVGRSKLELNSLLTLVQNGNGLRSRASNRHDSKVSNSLVGISQI